MINVIGLDIGTSSVKGVAVGPKGERLSAAKRDFTYQSPREGWKELAAEDYLETCGSLLRQLASAESGEIGAVCAASASGNLLILDSDGTPLTKIINWQDRRVKEEARELLKTDVTAVFCMADRMAGGVYNALDEKGLRAGRDIAVAGFDNQDIAEYFVPGLTTMTLPLREIGSVCADLVLRQMEGQDPGEGLPEKVLIPCTFMERDSVQRI